MWHDHPSSFHWFCLYSLPHHFCASALLLSQCLNIGFKLSLCWCFSQMFIVQPNGVCFLDHRLECRGCLSYTCVNIMFWIQHLRYFNANRSPVQINYLTCLDLSKSPQLHIIFPLRTRWCVMESRTLMMLRLFLKKVLASRQNQEHVSSRSHWHRCLHLTCFSCPEKICLQVWGCGTEHFICVTLHSSICVFHLSFLCSLPCPLWPFCLFSLCPPMPLFLCRSSSLSANFYPPFSPRFPCLTCLTPMYHWGSQRPLSVLPLLCLLVSPFFPCSSPFTSLHVSVSVFLHLSFSFSLSVWYLSQAHTFHIEALLPSSFKLEFLNLSVLFPSQKYMPRCCVWEVSVKMAHAGTFGMCQTSHAHRGEMYSK